MFYMELPWFWCLRARLYLCFASSPLSQSAAGRRFTATVWMHSIGSHAKVRYGASQRCDVGRVLGLMSFVPNSRRKKNNCPPRAQSRTPRQCAPPSFPIYAEKTFCNGSCCALLVREPPKARSGEHLLPRGGIGTSR